ncbi:TRAP transporter substrate-binding protein [Stutzerimonas azotifigens]|uniref:TRAP transporter substrate-binding protein n=1 Tax=Stutzerimonas azotifigens TaxID=291995 RepID=UPI0004864339|nr:TRAP transporter substrate-binding protein [Stutzerimonas azotifigens]
MKTLMSRFGLPALACAIGLATFDAQAAERWNMTVENPDGNSITEVAKEFARNVAAATDNELQIRVHSNSVLFKRPEVKRAVQTGQVQAGDVLMSVLGNEDPIFEADSVPFLARSYPEARKLWQASRPLIEARLEKQGIRLLYAMPWSPQSIYTQKPVNGMADFKGMKFRAYNPATSRMVELMGAVPTVINVAEVPQAFSTGMINAMLTSPTTGVDTQAWDFAKHYYDVQAFIPKNMVIVNARAFGRLPEAAQKAVLDAAAKAEEQGWQAAEAETGELVKKLADNGMQIHAEAPADIEAALADIGRTMTDEWLRKAGEDGQKVVGAFQN